MGAVRGPRSTCTGVMDTKWITNRLPWGTKNKNATDAAQEDDDSDVTAEDEDDEEEEYADAPDAPAASGGSSSPFTPFIPSKRAVIAKGDGVTDAVTWIPGYLKLDRFSSVGMAMRLHFAMLDMLEDMVPMSRINATRVLAMVAAELFVQPAGAAAAPPYVPPRLRSDLAEVVRPNDDATTPTHSAAWFAVCNPLYILFHLILDDRVLEYAQRRNVQLSLLLEYCLWWNEQLRIFLFHSASAMGVLTKADDRSWDRWYTNALSTMQNRLPAAEQYLQRIATKGNAANIILNQATAPDPWLIIRYLRGEGFFGAQVLPLSNPAQAVTRLFVGRDGQLHPPDRSSDPLFLLCALRACLSARADHFSPNVQACIRAVSKYGEGVNPTLLSRTAETALAHAMAHLLTVIEDPHFMQSLQPTLEGLVDRATTNVRPVLEGLIDRAVAQVQQRAADVVSSKSIGTLVGAACASLLVELELLQLPFLNPGIAPPLRARGGGLYVQQPQAAATTFVTVLRPVVLAAYPLLFLLTHRVFQRFNNTSSSKRKPPTAPV